MNRDAATAFDDLLQLKLGSCRTTVRTRADGKTGGIHPSESFGTQPHDDALRVKKAGIVQVAVNDGKAPPIRRKVGPEDGGDRATAMQNVLSLSYGVGVYRKRQVVVGWKGALAEIEHAAIELRVVEELNVGKIGKQLWIDSLPR